MKGELILRKARREDALLVMNFIRELAEYERLSADVTGTEKELLKSLFGSKPIAEVLLAFWKGAPAGFAVYFYQFSTFKTAPVLYLEDLFVKPCFRRAGIGKALFEKLISLGRAAGCCRMQWAVLDWNKPALAFYRGIGASQQSEWLRFELPLPSGKSKAPRQKSPGRKRKL